MGGYRVQTVYLPTSNGEGCAFTSNHCGIPESVKIKWKKSITKQVIERDVAVKSKLPKGFRNGDTIIFNINDNDEVILSFRMQAGKFEEVDSNGNPISFKGLK